MKIKCKHCEKTFELKEYDYELHRYGDCMQTPEDRTDNKNSMIGMMLFVFSVMQMGVTLEMNFWFGILLGFELAIAAFLINGGAIMIFRYKKSIDKNSCNL